MLLYQESACSQSIMSNKNMKFRVLFCDKAAENSGPIFPNHPGDFGHPRISVMDYRESKPLFFKVIVLCDLQGPCKFPVSLRFLEMLAVLIIGNEAFKMREDDSDSCFFEAVLGWNGSNVFDVSFPFCNMVMGLASRDIYVSFCWVCITLQLGVFLCLA